MNTKNFLPFEKLKYVFLYLIVSAGFIMRTYGLNWDQNQHLHPDERFMTMVTQAVSWPTSFDSYLDPNTSTINPRNVGFDFFVYGALPLKIVKLASSDIALDNFEYNNVTLVGRLLSALLDTAIIFLVFLVAKKVFNSKAALLASFIYSFTVLPIQLSHYYAVDTFLVFFTTLCFYLLILLVEQLPLNEEFNPKSEILNSKQLTIFHIPYSIFFISTLLGTSFGLALASKISAILFLPTIGLGFILVLYNKLTSKSRTLSFLSFCLFVFLSSSYISFRFANPENFQTASLLDLRLNIRFLANLTTLKSFNDPNGFFPPAVQWITTKPVTFALGNNFLWGLGIPLGVLSTLAIVFYSLRILKSIKQPKILTSFTTNQVVLLLMLFWTLSLFFYQSVQFSKNLRYFYPIYPAIAVLTASFIVTIGQRITDSYKKIFLPLFYSFTLLLLIIWPLSFLSIYFQSHSRITASEWIYQNIPAGSVISCDLWDDCLPLPFNNNYPGIYKTEMLEPFTPDTSTKWNKLTIQLQSIDYLILSSNRTWGSISKVPEKYPLMSKFYTDLFEENLGFEKVAEFTSFPKLEISRAWPFGLGNWKLEIPDEVAEESFTVYDHPKVMIFRRTKN